MHSKTTPPAQKSAYGSQPVRRPAKPSYTTETPKTSPAPVSATAPVMEDPKVELDAPSMTPMEIIVKLTEYAAAFEHNISLSSSPFHMFYLSLTFFHFMHVILGLVILIAMWNGARQGRYRPGDMNGLETGAAYWHMVDLVWLILFPLVYVIH